MQDILFVRFLLIGCSVRASVFPDSELLSPNDLHKALQRIWPEISLGDITRPPLDMFIRRTSPMSLDPSPKDSEVLTSFFLGVLEQGELSLLEIFQCAQKYWSRITIGVVKERLDLMVRVNALAVDHEKLSDDSLYRRKEL